VQGYCTAAGSLTHQHDGFSERKDSPGFVTALVLDVSRYWTIPLVLYAASLAWALRGTIQPKLILALGLMNALLADWAGMVLASDI
jgi:hypothetical protein